jgi:hypothetical protein
MNRRSCILFLSFLALARVLYAQDAINSGANTNLSDAVLPVRNLQIEVRQRQHEDSARAAVESAGTARISPGRSTANIDITAQGTTRGQAAMAHQQVLVLNGRRATIALRNTLPLRLMQAYVRNGVMVLVPGTVLIETGTGFDATPRWDGENQVELELTAFQGQGMHQTQTSSAATLLMVPLGEWITVAQTDQEAAGSRSGRDGSADWTAQSGTEVQVRVSVP